MQHIDEIKPFLDEYDSVRITYYKNQYMWVYFKESQIYTNLKLVIDNLVQSFFQEVVINESFIPVIITDSALTQVYDFGNIDTTQIETPGQCRQLADKMARRIPHKNSVTQ